MKKILLDNKNLFSPGLFEIGAIPASVLRKAGWKFRATELVGEPVK